MSDPSESATLGRRLRRLPGQFLLALVNATAILVILAAVLALVAVGRLEGAAHQVSTIVGARLSPHLTVDGSVLAQEVRGLRDDLASYRTALGEQKAEAEARIAERLDRLELRLVALESGIEELTSVKAQITDETVRQAGAALTDSMLALLHCGRPVTGDGPPVTALD